MFIHTHTSTPKRFAKFGCQTGMFCHIKVGKAVAKLESDRLKRCPFFLFRFITDAKVEWI